MTATAPIAEVPARKTQRRHRAPNGPGKFVTDHELVELLGVPWDVLKYILLELDSKHTGFPRKQKLWGDRRYWPAIEKWLDRQNGLNIELSPVRRAS